jgi:hypothetical protein
MPALAVLCALCQALPAYQRALDLNPMSEEIISKVRELKKKVPKVMRHGSTSTPLVPGSSCQSSGLKGC